MQEFAKKQKMLEINPRSPLIQGMLRRLESLPDGEERDVEAEEELKEVASILIDGALVRSGFEVPDSNEYAIVIACILSTLLTEALSPGSSTAWTVHFVDHWVCLKLQRRTIR